MKRLQTDGRRHGDGLNKCYRVLLRYSHHLPHRSGRAVTACGSPQTANCPLSFCPLLIGMLAMNWMGKKSLKRNADPISFSKSARVRVPVRRAKGNGARMRALWGPGRSWQTSASWQTHNKQLRLEWFSGWNEQTWKWTNSYIHIYARRGNERKQWHTAINTSAACIVLYITKKEVFTKTNTHCCLSICFLFSSHLKQSKNILFGGGVGDINPILNSYYFLISFFFFV